MNNNVQKSQIGRFGWIAGIGLIVVIALYFGWNTFSTSRDGVVTDDTPASSFDTDVSFRLKWILYSGWAGELLADSEGFWEEEGLSVSMNPGGFELDPLRLVASGADEIGVAGADQILIARERGLPLVAFAVQYQLHPVGFVSHQDSGIEGVEDFAGKRVGVKFGTDAEPIYRALLALEGVPPNTVTEVPVKFDLSPFYTRQIDIYPGYVTSDLLLPEEQGVPVNTIRAIDYGVRVYGNVYFTTAEYLRENPETVRRFLRAVTKGWQTALQLPPERIAELAVRYNDSLDLKHETAVAESLPPYLVPEGISFGSMTTRGWEELYNLLRKQGVLREDFEWEEAFTLEFVSPNETSTSP